MSKEPYAGFSEVGPMTDKAEKACNEAKFSYYNIESRLVNLKIDIGEIVDAVFPLEQQRDAVRGLLESSIEGVMLDVYNEATGKED